MAAPADMTIKTLSGEFALNLQLSDPTEPIFEMLGVSMFMRKMIAKISPAMGIRQYEEGGADRIEIKQLAKKSIPPTVFVVNGESVKQDEGLIGVVNRTTQLMDGANLVLQVKSLGGDAAAEAFLAGETTSEGASVGTNTFTSNGELLESTAISAKGDWKSEQTWGFETIDGKKYHVRRMCVVKGGKQKLARWVYDYKG